MVSAANRFALLLLLLLVLIHGVVSKLLTVLVQPVASTAGEPLTLQPVVALTDDSGNILTTESLGTVSARIGVNPLRYASIQPQGISFAITNGVARCSGLYINMASTGYTIVLESIYHGVRVETAPFDVLVGPIHSLQIVADISTAYGGVAFLPQPAVAVVDKGGNIVTVQNTGTVRIEILHNPTGGHLLPTANYNVTIGGGLAKYQSMYIDVAGSPYSLRYTTDLVLPGGSIVDTNPFTVAAGACSDLVLLASPVGATGGKAFGIQPVVKLVDAGNNTLISDSSSVVHVAIASNPSNGVISPVSMLEMPVRKGIATFRSLKIDKAGNDYSLIYTLYTKNPGVNTYTKTAVTKTSQPFNIAVGSPVTLAFQQNISNGVLDGQPNEQQPVLAILDSGGNVVSSITTGSVTATMVPSAAISSSIIVDTSNAPLLAITSATALANASYPMPYGVGLLLSVAVTFSDEVMASGVPTLTLATAPASGLTGVSECVTLNTWTTTLVFQYDIVLSDGTTQLNYASTAALSLNGGTITDRNGNTPVLTLPSLTSFNSLAGTSTVVIDTTAPVITAVTCASPGNGDYGTGEMISLQVVFSRPVTVYGSPLLPVGLTTVGVTGERVRNAIFTSGNNTNMLVFLYVVQNGDAMVTPTTLLDVTANINVNGGYIKHYSTRPTTDVNVTMVTAPNNLASRQSITIDTSAPVVDASVGVTSTTTNGVYAPGDAIAILVTFTKPVIVREYPRLYLETGSVKRAAGYSSGNATKVLKFIYTVSSYDTHSATGNAHLNYRDDNAIDLNGGSIRRLIQSGSASADAVLSLAAVTLAGKSLKDNAQIDLSGQPATVLALTILSAPSTTVSRGDVITISVSFSSKVTVNTTLGKPSLHLAVGTSDRQAIYTSGSGTQALVFTYDVKLGDLAPGGLDYRTTSSLMLNGGTIRKTSNNSIQDAFLTLPAPSLALASPPVLVDRTYNYSTTIQSLTADVPAGEYGSYQVVTLTVTFSDEVSVDGLPTLHLNTGTQAEFLGGSATSQLSFVYVVKDNDYTTSLDKFDDSALVCVTPCVIINYNSVAVNISMAGISLAPANIIIDTTAPTVVSVYSPTLASQVNSNAFVVGDIIQIIVEMSLEVFIDPPTTDQPLKAPLLILNTTMDGQPVLCVGYANGNRKLLLFSYTVQAGDIQDDLTYVDEDSLTLNSDQCAIKRFSTTPRTDAVLTLPAPVPLGQNNSQVLNVNTTVTPSVVGVTSSKANGLYRCGDTIDIIITFTQNVVVLGSPFLWLDLGTNTPTANYTNGSGGLELTFSYTVQEGDYTMDMEYIDVHSLDTSADTDWILQRSTNPTTIASTDLPYPYTQNSLSFNKNLQINGRKPRVVSAAFVSADGTYGAGAQLVMQISFSSCVVVDTSANTVPLLRFQPSPSETQIITRYATYTSGSPGVSLRFQYTVQAGDTATDLDYADTQSIVQNGARILTCTATGAAPVQSADLHLNPPGGQLLGTTSKAITFGRVTYTDLLVDRLGNEYIVLFRTQVGPLTLEAAATFDVKYSAAYRLRSSPFASGDSLGTSVDVSGDTLVLGAPSAKEPQSAIQIVTATGDSMVYVDEIQIIQTTAKQQPAIQEITSSAAPGETVSGWFYLQSGVVRTRKLYYNFDAAQIQVALELDLGFGIGTTKVTRTENIYCSCYEGYVWSITFLYVEGPLAPLGTIAGALTGRAATVGDGRGADQARVVVESTTITGFYTLQLGTLVSSNIRYNAGEDELASIIEQDLLTPVRRVTRSGPTGLQGYSWSITFVASSALYDVPQLAPQSVGLQGYQAVAIVQTLREGLGRLSGAFRLRFRNDIFPNDETGDIAVNASDLVMMTALNKLTSINSVQVVRSTAMNTYGGYSWTITFVQVNTKNAYGPVVDTSGNLPALVPVTSTIISGKPTVLLQGTKARVVVQVGGYHLAPLAVGDTVWGLPGTNAGMASVFIRDGNVWKQQGGTLTGSDTRAGDFFGTSVAIRDDLLLVGAPGAAVFGDFEQQRLLCTADGGYFRLSYRNKMSSPIAYNANKNTLQLAIVSIMSVSYGYVEITTPFTNLCGGNEITIVLRSGDHGDSNGAIHDLAIDASTLTSGPGAGSGILQEYHAGTFKDDGIVSKGLQCGAAYMFRRNSGTGVWSQEAKLAPPADAYFVNISDYGSHVAIYDTFAVIGAPGAYSEEGRVFVYQFNAVATTWSLFQILTAAPYNIVEGDRFGAAVAISGNPLSTITIAVGAPGYATETGAVFVFDLIDGVFRNQQFMLLETPELQQGDQFGSSLDLDMLTTYTLVVGAPLNQLANGLDSGLALIFTRRSPSDTFFNLQQIVYGSDTRTRDRFGTSVGISRNTIVVGAHESYRGPRTIRKPVQSVTSSCTGGIIQGGTFTLSFKRAVAATNTVVRVVSRALPYNIDADTLEAALESDFPFGNIIVERDGPDTDNGYTWYLTFAAATSAMNLLEVNGTQLIPDNDNADIEIEMAWVVRFPPILRSNAYVFTRNPSGKWTEQMSLFPRKKQYFSWFGSAVAIDQRTAIVGAPNLDTYETGINAGGGFVFDLGILSLGFASKNYSVLEGSSLRMSVQRCGYNSGFCAIDVSRSPKLYVNYGTGDTYSDRRSSNYVPVIPLVGPYQKLSMLETVPLSTGSFFARNVTGQEPFPLVPRGRWLAAAMVGTANGRNQYYGSSQRQSLWIDSDFDYAGESDYASSVGELVFALSTDTILGFTIVTTDDFVVEDPDETIMVRLSLPGVWPTLGGQLWSTVTITDDGDGGSGTRSYLEYLSAGSAGQTGSQYSAAVSVFSDGNVALVGAPLEKQTTTNQNDKVACGAVYFYVRKLGMWEFESKKTPVDCKAGMRYGASVSVDGSLGTVYAIVGAPGMASAFIYRRDGTNWIQDIQLSEPDATSLTQNYGGRKAVNIHGDVAVVGASGLESIYVYHRGMNGWELNTRLYCSDRVVYQIFEQIVQQEYQFGFALDIYRRTIAVGAPFADSGTYAPPQYHDRNFDKNYFGMGAVYIFHLQAQVQQVQLFTDDPIVGGTFCLSVTYRGTLGTTRAISYSSTSADLKSALEEISQLKLVEVSRTGTIDQGFMWMVTFIGAILTVPLLTPTWLGYGCTDCIAFTSSYKANPAKQVSVTNVTPLGTWRQQARLVAPDGNPGDRFGSSVAISGEQVIVGAPNSPALATTTWNFETGDLTGWLTTGTAFDAQPTFGDNSYARINVYSFHAYSREGTGTRSLHEGRYWVGTFENRPGASKQTATITSCSFGNDLLCKQPFYKLPGANAAGTYQGDGPVGTMTSQTFTVLGPWLSFKLGGGCDIRLTYVELLVDGIPSNLKSTGRCMEGMWIVNWDLTSYQNQTAQIRVVDASNSDAWGHINFDDVRFSWDPTQTSTPRAGVAYTFRRKAPGTLEPCVNINRMLCDWEFQARLIASDKRTDDTFGFDVAVDDTTGIAVVGAPGQTAWDANNTEIFNPYDGSPMEGVGSIYVFTRADETRDGKGILLTPPKWSPKEVSKLQYPKKQQQSRFGSSLSLDRYSLLVGAPGFSTTPLLYQVGQIFAYDIAFATVQFTAPLFYCVEGNSDGVVSLAITRSSSNLSLPLTVGYATEDLNAQAVDSLKYKACMLIPVTQRKDCLDYQQVAGEITFAAGETSKQILIPIIDDLCNEVMPEYFVVRLNVPGGEALLGENYITRVRIDDDDFSSDLC